jgi:hypothetical protein
VKTFRRAPKTDAHVCESLVARDLNLGKPGAWGFCVSCVLGVGGGGVFLVWGVVGGGGGGGDRVSSSY